MPPLKKAMTLVQMNEKTTKSKKYIKKLKSFIIKLRLPFFS